MSLPRQVLQIDVEEALGIFGFRRVGMAVGLVLYRNPEGHRILLDYPDRRVDLDDLRFAVQKAGLNLPAFEKALCATVVPPDS